MDRIDLKHFVINKPILIHGTAEEPASNSFFPPTGLKKSWSLVCYTELNMKFGANVPWLPSAWHYLWASQSHDYSTKVKTFKPWILHRDLCKKNCTNVLLHSISNTYDFAFIYLYTQSTHIDNSKMVKWVHIAQKLTKIQGIM